MSKVNQMNKILDRICDLSESGYTNRWSKAGSMFALLSEGYKDMANMAYSYFEAHNYHAVCALLNWVFDIYDFHHISDLSNIRWLFENIPFRVISVSQTEIGKWETKKYRAKIIFEEVEQEISNDKSNSLKHSQKY